MLTDSENADLQSYISLIEEILKNSEVFIKIIFKNKFKNFRFILCGMTTKHIVK